MNSCCIIHILLFCQGGLSWDVDVSLFIVLQRTETTFSAKKKKKSSLGVVRGGIYHWTVNHGKTDEKDVYLCCAKRALVEKNGEGVHGGDRVHC